MTMKTTLSGTVYGSMQNPGLSDSMVTVLGCADGSVAVAWGNALEHGNEGDEIYYGGDGDGENGYHVIIDPTDLAPVGEYILDAFIETQDDESWEKHANGDVFVGLLHVGHIGADGTLSLRAELADCGLSWRRVQSCVPVDMLLV